MKMRVNSTSISVLLITLSLLTFVPGALRLVSEGWREPYLEFPGLRFQNNFAMIGLFALGFVTVGLVALWTGYRRNERWAWFTIFLIWLFFYCPELILPGFINVKGIAVGFEWRAWLEGIRAGDHLTIGVALGILNVVVMFVALLLPLRAFSASKPPREASDILS